MHSSSMTGMGLCVINVQRIIGYGDDWNSVVSRCVNNNKLFVSHNQGRKRDLLLLDLSKGFLSELAQRCIERFVIFKRLGFHRKRVIIELCLDCVKQTTCYCSHNG